jgi:hypothetical protein
MSGLAMRWPRFFEYTEKPSCARSASRPWPTASWIIVPPASAASTTGILPPGAGRAASICTARRAACSAMRSSVSGGNAPSSVLPPAVS